MTETPDHFKALLAAFKELPPTPQRDPTTLELSGYPHLENVYSNILAFFLDPGCEHGFGSLFLESLLSVAGYDARQDGEGVEVKTEESTMSRKRIDLVIYTGTLIVGIENKIYQPLHNDLEDYGRHLTEQANGRSVCKILLGLNLPPEDDQKLFGFKPITYREYFDEILRRIGHTLIASKDRYLIFLLEVIETVKHLTEGSVMKPEMLDFFKNNEEDVISLLQETTNLKKDLREAVKTLGEILNISDLQNQDRRINQWFYRESNAFFDTLVHDITIEDGFVLAIDTCISLNGWNVAVFARAKRNSQRIKLWLETQEDDWEEKGTRYLLDLSDELPYDAPIKNVADRVKPLLKRAMTDPFPFPQ